MSFFMHHPVMIFPSHYNICKIFAEGNFLTRKISIGSEATTITSLAKDIHGAPPESLVVKLAEVIGSFRTLRKMVLFWCRVATKVSVLYRA
jgi:Rab3 GTPase-activating protein catalytic subunit